jgi:AraC-like DNA-binding protein
MVMVTVQVSGTCLTVQDGRRVVLRAGQFALTDTTQPYARVCPGECVQYAFRIPHARLALPRPALREMTSRALGPGNPVADVAAGYLTRLGSEAALRTGPAADLALSAGIDLVRAAIVAELADDARREHETLTVQIMAYVRTHLAEHDLTPARIAAAHHVSLRQLYTVLGRAGISPADWIRSLRLEAARDDLRRMPAPAVATVGRRWGFMDPTNFSRAFRQAYGMSPRECRDTRLPPR